jgi:putative sigma-54 modulation protein
MSNPTTNDISHKLHLQGIHVDFTAAMQDVMRDKLSVLLRHNEWIVRVNVRLHHNQTLGRKHLYSATGQIEIRGPDIVATATGDDVYSVIDELVGKMDEQLRNRHERRKDRRNHPHGVEMDAGIPKVGGETIP